MAYRTGLLPTTATAMTLEDDTTLNERETTMTNSPITVQNVKILINRGMDIIFAESVSLHGLVLHLRAEAVAGQGEEYIVSCLQVGHYERICGKTGQIHFMTFDMDKGGSCFKVDEKATAEALAKKEASKCLTT